MVRPLFSSLEIKNSLHSSSWDGWSSITFKTSFFIVRKKHSSCVLWTSQFHVTVLKRYELNYSLQTQIRKESDIVWVCMVQWLMKWNRNSHLFDLIRKENERLVWVRTVHRFTECMVDQSFKAQLKRGVRVRVGVRSIRMKLDSHMFI